jgi:aldehyde dehydrogenase (NAD+)
MTDKISGRTASATGNLFGHTRRESIGVCGLISPWNFPLLMGTWKLAPCLAAGNTCVHKISELTPLSHLFLADLLNKAGLPPGVVNFVPGYGKVAGEAIIKHPEIKKVSFTGSTLIGRRVLEASSQTNLKKVTLELGGKSPAIICEDADLVDAADEVAKGIFFNMGQCCVASSRVLVQESIYDKFVELLAERARGFSVGNGLEKKNNFGPLVSQMQFDKVMGFFKHAKENNYATLVVGGDRHGEKGYFVQPTVYRDVDDSCKMSCEEIFGPVLAILKPFKTLDEALERANNTNYGLAAGIFSKDQSKIERAVRTLKAGTVWANNFLTLVDYLPFGGYKESGFGRDLGIEAIEEYTIVKTVIQKFNF